MKKMLFACVSQTKHATVKTTKQLQVQSMASLLILFIGLLIFSTGVKAQVIDESFEEAPWSAITFSSTSGNVSVTGGAVGGITYYTNFNGSTGTVTTTGTTTRATVTHTLTSNNTTPNSGLWWYSKGSTSSDSRLNKARSASHSWNIGSSGGYLITPVLPGGIASVTIWSTRNAQILIGANTNASVTGTDYVPSVYNTTASGLVIGYTVGFQAISTNGTSCMQSQVITINNTNPCRLGIFSASGSSVYIDDISITAPVVAAPATQAHDISFTGATATTVDISWVNGDGGNRAVFVREASAGSITNPSDGSPYSASANWTIKGSQLGASGYYCVYNGTSNTVSLTGLSPATSYYAQIFEYNGAGAATKYNVSTAVLNPNNGSTGSVSAPTVATAAITNITGASADGGGNVTSDGGSPITQRGVVYSTSANPTTADSKVIDGFTTTGSFVSNIPGLNPATTYHVRAYATNAINTSYGSDVQFTTAQNFRSFQSGPWNLAVTWEAFDGANWVAAAAAPDANSGLVTIQATHVVTSTAALTLPSMVINGELDYNTATTLTLGANKTVTVNGILQNQCTTSTPVTLGAGASITVASGGTYKMDAAGGVLPTNVTFVGINSTLYVSKLPSTGDAGRLPATFAGSIIWDAGNAAPTDFQLVPGTNSSSITGNLTFKSGESSIGSGGTGRSLTVGGRLRVEGGTLAIKGRSGELGGSGTFSITANGDSLVVTGGNFYTVYPGASAGGSNLNIKGSIRHSGGVFGNAGSTVSSITLNGATAQSITTTGVLATGRNNVTLNNANGLTLGSNVSINGTLALTSGTVALNGHQLDIAGANGNITGNSSSNHIIGSAASSINVSSAAASFTLFTKQVADGADNALANLTVSAGNVTLIGKINIYNSLNATGGTINLNAQSVILKSTAGGTARVGEITGTLSGASNVTVERYIPAKKAWRLLTIPVTGSQTIRQAWANGAAPLASALAASGETVGKGTIITGHGYSDAATANAAGYDYIDLPLTVSSIRSYVVNGTSGGWPASLASTPSLSTTASTANQGYLMYIRGDRTVTSGAATPTVLAATGGLKINGQTVTIPPAATHVFEVVGNPYASPIDFEDLAANAGNSTAILTDRFWTWDANNGATGYNYLIKNVAGTWRRVPTPFTGNGSVVANIQHIQSSQAIYVAPTATGGTLTINEEDKSNPGAIPPVFSPVAIGQLYTNLSLDNNGSYEMADGVLNLFDNSYAAAITDKDDVIKMGNINESITIANGKSLSLDARPIPVENDVVNLEISKMQVRNYALQFMAQQMPAGTLAFLKDKFLGTENTISLGGDITTYPFTVTSNTASSSVDRFSIIFKQDGSLPVALTAKSYQLNSGVQVDWNTMNEQKVKTYQVEKSTNGTSFTLAKMVTAIGNAVNNYTWYDASPVRGDNFYRIKTVGSDGKTAYSQVMKVNIGGTKAGFSIYPNPAKDHNVSVQITSLDKGQYTLTMHDATGRLLLSRTIQHNGGSATETINIGSQLAAGVYKVSLGGMTQTLVIQ